MAWVAPRTWATNEALTAAKMNEISSSLHAIGDGWTAFSTTWDAQTTSPAIGNGSISASYRQAGKTVDYKIILTIGSSTTMGTGAWTFTAPVAFAADILLHHPMGRAGLFDSSANATVSRGVQVLAVSTRRLILRDESGTSVTGTVPWTWAVNDRLMMQGTYETS